MDPHGILESLVIEIANNSFYGIEPVIESLPYPMRVRKSLFTGKHLPLTYPLPKRIDKSFQGRVGLLAYDLIVIAGVDVQTFTPQEQLNLAGYVLHGGGLMLLGGSYSFGNSDGTYQLLEGVLPARIPVAEEVQVYEKPRLGDYHPVIRGLRGDFGVVCRVHPLEVKAEGKVLLKVDSRQETGDEGEGTGHPLLVCGEAGKGKVVLVATYPPTADTKTPDGRAVGVEEGFFTSGECGDLMRQAISWLVGRDSDLVVERFEALAREGRGDACVAHDGMRLALGASVTFKAVVNGPGDGKGRAHLRVLKAGNRLLSQRREPRFSHLVAEQEVEIGGRGESVECSWQSEDSPYSAGLYRARVEFRGKDPTKTLTPAHLVPVDEWAVVREVDFVVEKKEGLKAALEGGKYAFGEGMKAAFAVEAVHSPPPCPSPVEMEGRTQESPEGEAGERAGAEPRPYEAAKGGTRGTVTAGVVDFRGRRLKEWHFKAEELPVRLEYEIPNLAKGEYTFAACISDESGEILDTVEQVFHIVDPVPKDDDLRFVGSLPREGLSERRIEEEIGDRLRHGFNCLTATAPIGDYEENALLYRRGDYSDWLAMEKGMMLWGEYEGLSILKTHGPWWEEREGVNATRPCVLTPEYRERLREFLARKFEVAERIPRLLTMEILDEPHVLPANVCHCEVCEGEYKRRYGEEMPTWRELRGVRSLRRLNYFDWIGDYFGEGFKIGYELVKELRERVGANHVIAPLAWGLFHIEYCFADDLKWTPYCDTLEFDCYNYMYAHFRCAPQLPFHQFHYQFAAYRQLGRKFDKRLGFFIQLDDRDFPHDIEPIRAPAEIAYTAIGQGAKDFHLMFKPTFAVNFGLREEKWDDFGRHLVKIRRASPVIANCTRTKGRLAMVFPYTNFVLNPPPIKLPPGYVGIGFYGKEERPYNELYPYGYTPYNPFELLYRGFGEAELIHETLVAEGDAARYQALALWGAEYLSDAAAEKIVEFVEEGGLLLCDCIPSKNEKGEETHLLDALFAGRESSFYGDLRLIETPYGKGRTLLFSRDTNEPVGAQFIAPDGGRDKSRPYMSPALKSLIDEAYSGAIEEDNGQLWELLEEKVKEFLFQNGVLPHAYSENPQIEANLLQGEGCLVLVAVNHSPNWEETTVYLYDPPIQPKYAVDLLTMEEVPIVDLGGAFTVELGLEERRGQILAFYPELPVSQRIEVVEDEVAKGEDLSYTVSLLNKAGKPARGQHVVEVTLVDSEGKIQPRYGGVVSTRNGVYSRSIPIALNEAPGQWIIFVFDRFTRQKGSATFTVVPSSAVES